MKDINKALDAVDMTYDNLIVIANDTFNELVGDVSELVTIAYDNVENLTNDNLRELMLKLALKSYSFSEIKDKASFKATLAETLRKEAYAIKFNEQEGSVAAKDNLATLAISEEIIAENIYDLISTMLKTKSDEIHRVVDVLKTVLMSRNAEAKLTNIDIA